MDALEHSLVNNYEAWRRVSLKGDSISLNKANKNTNTLLNYFKIEENNNSCEENGYRIKYIYV